MFGDKSHRKEYPTDFMKCSARLRIQYHMSDATATDMFNAHADYWWLEHVW